MNVLLISQCSKRAREESCRILDCFAERKGDGAWQTAITLEGLNTLRRLLCKTARRNTAVACHWIKTSGQTELMWIVGNLRQFNAEGSVPTHRTARDIVRRGQEHGWQSAEAIALLAAIAGLFHDFGKANRMFQQAVTGGSGPKFQPLRHEWVSVRLFQTFIGEQDDRGWLTQLGKLEPDDEAAWLARLVRDTKTHSDSPLKALPPLAKTVAWLIVSHHRLPQYLPRQSGNPPDLAYHNGWLDRQLNADWNALNRDHKDIEPQHFDAVWQFPHGTPLQSTTWREKARQIARRAANAPSLLAFGNLDQLFTLHMARLTLMLADHHYSAGKATPRWQDSDYAVWANTDRQTGLLKQRLDEHNVGVGHNALLLGRALPWLQRALPAIARHKLFRERATDKRFRWQNRAWDTAFGLREASQRHGFFGVNMASTGCGKTFANARIMYALANGQAGCRFTVALGLRTLTLQTGDALRERLELNEEDLAVLIGSGAVRELHQLRQKDETPEDDNSSDSQAAYFAEHQYVHYDGSLESGPLRHWLAGDAALNRLVSAPIVVATVDHLVPATESVRGGKQIPAMLRLLTSDLVLDEPDDFNLEDTHALCRLVNWAGMLGSRVLLSSATLPPSLVQALFAAYVNGRRQYQAACGEPGTPVNIACAWFDEFDSCAEQIADGSAFRVAHKAFVAKRVKALEQKDVLCRARIAAVEPMSSSAEAVIDAVAQVVRGNMLELHQHHHEVHPGGQTVSFGMVRIANINPLVALAKALAAMPSPDDYCIHYCVYHARHPLAVRSMIEAHLDAAFDRSDGKKPWRLPLIAQALRDNPARHHLFVVLSSPVCEVGRDWDASYGIIEPSSMRSLIQFPGRIQRHRQQVPNKENLIILDRNIRGMREPGNAEPAFCLPGFENKIFKLTSRRVSELLTEAQYREINAIPRIVAPDPLPKKNKVWDSLTDLEHCRQQETLLGNGEKVSPVARYWWNKTLTWSGELQRRTPFRLSAPELSLYLYMAEEDDAAWFMRPQDKGNGWKDSGQIKPQPLTFATGVAAWIPIDYRDVLLTLAERLELELSVVSERFGEIRLRASKEGEQVDDWFCHPFLGVFRALD